nr:ATP-binding protein [Hyphomonadaceae bacterium]
LARATELYASAGEQPRGARGTGLGLALVRQLTGLQGGRFTLESAPGVGTTARIVLPTASNTEPS